MGGEGEPASKPGRRAGLIEPVSERESHTNQTLQSEADHLSVNTVVYFRELIKMSDALTRKRINAEYVTLVNKSRKKILK